MTQTTSPEFEHGDAQRLETFGLSHEVFHDGLRAGATRAANRSALALAASPGTDIYHDGMEGLAQILVSHGWRPLLIDKQPRLVHPDGIVSFAVSSGINVGKSNMRTPRTRRKGAATRNSLATPTPDPSLFDDPEGDKVTELVRAAETAPFYFLLFERVVADKSGLLLEFSQPSVMTDGGSVVNWAARITVPFLELEGDLSMFDEPGAEEFDVPVEPR